MPVHPGIGSRTCQNTRYAGVTVSAGGIAVAATTDVVALEEQGYPTRYYLARDGVDPRSGHARAPGHRIAYVPRHAGVTVSAGGIAVAATTDVVALEEQGYPTRYYLARDGVDMTRVEKTGKTTYCPFKGLATYYVIRGPNGEIRDAAWSYEQTFREAELVRDRLAFDAGKVDESVG